MTKPDHPPLRIAVIGAGAFGREHIDRLATRRDAVLAAVADPSEKAHATVRARHAAVPVFADPLHMLGRENFDGVIVATPASTHFSITAAALSRKLPVLLEKPVLPAPDRARELMALAREAGTFILPGHILRFSADHARLAELAKSGAVGDILYINSRRYRDASHALRYPDTDPVLMTLIHDIDLAIWLAAAPFVSVRGSRTGGPGFQSLTTADLETASGLRCHLRTAWTFGDGDLPPDRLEVVGQHGSLELDAGRSLRHYAEGRCTELPLAANDDALVNEHDAFLARIRDRNAPSQVTMEEAATGLALAARILQSLTSRREIHHASEASQ